MYKKTIVFEDYDGNERKEDFFFNLNTGELIEMNMSVTGGLEKMLKNIIDAQDNKRLFEVFKDIILRSYGEKSADGKRFVKIDADGHRLAQDFMQTDAYSVLLTELVSDTTAATEFVNGIVPQKLAEEAAKNNA